MAAHIPQILLTAILLSVMGSPLIAAEELLKEDFEAEILNPDVKISPKGATSVEISEEKAQAGKYALKFRDSTDRSVPGYSPGSVFSFPLMSPGARMRISFDYFVEENTDKTYFLVDVGAKGDRNQDRLLRLIFSGAKLQASKNRQNQGKEISTELYPGGDWHHVVMEFTTERSDAGFTVAVDDHPVGELPFWTEGGDSGANYVSFSVDGYSDATLWIDNLLVERID